VDVLLPTGPVAPPVPSEAFTSAVPPTAAVSPSQVIPPPAVPTAALLGAPRLVLQSALAP
jgi:hypothetical protein